MKCDNCGTEFTGNACPSCSQGNNNVNSQKKAFYKKWWFWVLIVIAAIAVGAGGGNDKTGTNTSESKTKSEVSDIKEKVNDIADDVKEEVSVPMEYKNALKKAEIYSKTMHMSKQAIYDQLVSEYGEKFPAEAAQYAIDNIKADWKQNALKKAQTYQESMSMSTQAIYNQLTSEYGEKFTAEEAQYAIDNLAK